MQVHNDLGIAFYFEPKYAMAEILILVCMLEIMVFAGGECCWSIIWSTAIVPVLATGTFRFSDSKVTLFMEVWV